MEETRTCSKCAITQPASLFTSKSRSTCLGCRREQGRKAAEKYNAANPYKSRTEAYKERVNEAHRRWRAANREKMREKAYVYKYGITLVEYRRRIESQEHKCALCKDLLEEGNRREVHVDHCHATGRVRGILCRTCNHGLGFFKDSPERLAAAIDYLRDT